jgi:uncharacterized protein YbjT (DUF2867 family)
MRAMATRTALVAGGSGLVGGALIDLLLRSAEWTKTTAVGRRAPDRADPKLEAAVVDFAKLGATTLPKADAAFCCLGTTMAKAGSREAFRAVDLDAVVSFAKAAQAGGTRVFALVSAAGANPKSRVFYNRTKGEAEEALRGVGFQTLILTRPSLLVGDRAESRPGEHVAIVAARLLAPLLRPLPFRPIEATRVARALVILAETKGAGVHVLENRDLFACTAEP